MRRYARGNHYFELNINSLKDKQIHKFLAVCVFSADEQRASG